MTPELRAAGRASPPPPADRSASPPPAARSASENRGFAILIVLWFLVLLSAIGIHIAATGRSEARIAANLVAAAKAEALADGGVMRAVFALGDPSADQRWALDGVPHTARLGGGELAITVRDETAKVDANKASDRLLAAVLELAGVEGDAARALGAAIAATAQQAAAPGAPADGATPETPGGSGAPTPTTSAATGLPPGLEPPGQQPSGPVAFQALDDLMQIPGFNAEVLAKAAPYLTVYTGQKIPNLKAAGPLVRRAAESARAGPTRDDAPAAAAPTPPGQVPPVTVDISVVAHGPGGGVFVRQAIVKITPQAPQGYRILAWSAPPATDR